MDKKKIALILFATIIIVGIVYFVFIDTTNLLHQTVTNRGQGDVSQPSKTLTPSELTSNEFNITITRGGDGRMVGEGDPVVVFYSGYVIEENGELTPVSTDSYYYFTLGEGHVIEAWEQAVDGMRVGEVVEITAPPEMAYGEREITYEDLDGETTIIPPNSSFFFEIELLAIREEE